MPEIEFTDAILDMVRKSEDKGVTIKEIRKRFPELDDNQFAGHMSVLGDRKYFYKHQDRWYAQGKGPLVPKFAQITPIADAITNTAAKGFPWAVIIADFNMDPSERNFKISVEELGKLDPPILYHPDTERFYAQEFYPKEAKMNPTKKELHNLRNAVLEAVKTLNESGELVFSSEVYALIKGLPELMNYQKPQAAIGTILSQAARGHNPDMPLLGDANRGYYLKVYESLVKKDPDKPDETEIPTPVPIEPEKDLSQSGISIYMCGKPEEIELAPRITTRPDSTVRIYTEELYNNVKRVEVSPDDDNYVEFPHKDYTCFAGSDIPAEWENAAVQRGPCFVRITLGKTYESKGVRIKYKIPVGFNFASR